MPEISLDFICNFPLFIIILSLLCAVVSFVLPGKAARPLTLVLLSVCSVMNLGVLVHNYRLGYGFSYMMGHYPAPFGNEVSAGILEPFFALLFSAVMLLCVIGGKATIGRDIREDKRNYYYIMIDLAFVALMALCYTNDIFTGYVFIEICTLASCGLLMIRNRGSSLVAATRYMIFSLIGSSLFLIGVILMYSETGHLLFPQLKEAVALAWQSGENTVPMTVMIALMVIGLAIKSGLFPFHFWMPDTYGTATPASSGILSGVISKGYIFLLIKVIYRVIGIDIFLSTGAQNILFVFGICAMIVGSVSAIRSDTISKMTAFSSAAQIGYIYMGIGMGTPGALVAVFFHICTHAVTKPLLFLSADALSEASGGKGDFASLAGSGHRNPLAGFGFLCGSLSMIGFPLFSGFISKLYFALTAFELVRKTPFVLAALAVSTILNVIYFMYVSITLYKGKGEPETRVRHVSKPFAAALILFVIINIAVGMRSQPLTSLFEAGIGIFK